MLKIKEALAYKEQNKMSRRVSKQDGARKRKLESIKRKVSDKQKDFSSLRRAEDVKLECRPVDSWRSVWIVLAVKVRRMI